MTDSEIIAVVSAHKEGKKIQFRDHKRMMEWNDVVGHSPAWNFENLEYRVAPEPRELLEWNAWYLPENKSLTDAWMERHQDAGWRPIKVREVATSGEQESDAAWANTFPKPDSPRKPRDFWIVKHPEYHLWSKYSCKQSCCDQEQIHVVEVLE